MPTDLTPLEKELCEALEAVWRRAGAMRKSEHLVGPYPNDPVKHQVWARAMYHEGKMLQEMLKLVRIKAKDRTND